MPSLTNLAMWSISGILLIAGVGCDSASTPAVNKPVQINAQMLIQRGRLRFVADAQAGRQLAQQQGLPCLLFFTAKWCTFCHQMEETAFTAPEIGKLAENFVCVLVDADQEPAICQEFGISGYPSIQFLAADGRKLHRLVGMQTASELAVGMQAALDRVAWLDGGKALRR